MHEKYIALWKAHERLLIVMVLAIAGWYGWSKYLDKSAEKALADLAAAKQVAETQAQANAKLAEAAQNAAANYRALAAQTIQQNSALAAQRQQRDTETEQRKQQVAVEALPLVAVRWSTLLEFSPGELQPTADGRLSVSDEAARKTVKALEDLPTLRADLITVQTQYTNEQKLEAACEANTQICQAQVAGLAQQIHDDGQEFAASEKALKAVGRKQFIHGLQWGAGGGSIGIVILLGLIGVL